MSRKFKILLIVIGICTLYTLITYYPVISAYFDDEKYVDGEVFTPSNGVYDFKKFTLNSSQTKNFTTIIDYSGFAQLVDDKGNHTINVIEWDKMTTARRERLNSSFLLQLELPYHESEGIRIIEIDFLGDDFYGAYIYDEKSNILIYIATPNKNETIEMISSLEFKNDC